ncbi:MAG: class I SAM-dependent methyltransferase [Candidatus Hodarchaeales archaeon]
MNEKRITIRTCVKIPKSRGESVRRWLISLDNLDSSYRIGSDNDYLYFPVKNPEAIHGTGSSDLGTGFRLVEFPVQERTPKISYKKILRDKLPARLHGLIPSSFDLIGNVAVVKMEPNLESFKKDIGNAIISTTNAVTVYNKTGDVDGSYRLPGLELIAGEDVETVVHREHGVKMIVNIKKAFFNPRLGNEHQRIAELVEPGEIVLDFFTGVGPFALLITKMKKTTVFAVDINPAAIDCLNESMKINKLAGEIVSITGDIKTVVEKLPLADRIIMNLPGGSLGHLKLALEKIRNGGTIHFYGFSQKNAVDPLENVTRSVMEVLAANNFDGCISESFILREVSVAKFQIAIDIVKNP